jgi:hypothetical protein
MILLKGPAIARRHKNSSKILLQRSARFETDGEDEPDDRTNQGCARKVKAQHGLRKHNDASNLGVNHSPVERHRKRY